MKTRRGTGSAVIILLLVVTSCKSVDRSTSDGSLMTKQMFYFSDLPQMVPTSDLVIEGTVQTVEPGRVLGEGDAAIQFAQVILSVDRVLVGNIDAASVMVDDLGLGGDHASGVGDHGVYFLHQKADAPEFYRLVNTQGRFLDDGQGRLVALDDEAAWVKVIEGQSLSQLENAIEAIARDVAEGNVAPAKPNLPR